MCQQQISRFWWFVLGWAGGHGVQKLQGIISGTNRIPSGWAANGRKPLGCLFQSGGEVTWEGGSSGKIFSRKVNTQRGKQGEKTKNTQNTSYVLGLGF